MLRSVKLLLSRVVENEMSRLRLCVYSSMTPSCSKIWEMCFAGFGKIVWAFGAAAGPMLPVSMCGESVCSVALGGGAYFCLQFRVMRP